MAPQFLTFKFLFTYNSIFFPKGYELDSKKTEIMKTKNKIFKTVWAPQKTRNRTAI
jgi:hypothetical protein